MFPAPFAPEPEEPGLRRSGRLETYLFFAAIFAAIIFLSHASLLGTPYFWDEAGHYLPSVVDLFRDGKWIPHTTAPNVHPPLVKALVAVGWSITGVSIEATRATMLILAGFGVLGVFLLAIELSRGSPGAPAFLAVLFLLASPLYFMQSMMVQLDMPAMVFTTWALFLFLRGRLGLSLAACVLLVLTKETGALVPVLLAGSLASERRYRAAAAFVATLAPLAAWLVYLKSGTGHWLGDQEFTEYNVFYPLHPARLLASLVRRAVYLLVENFHWIGGLAILAGWRAGMFRTRGWRLAGWFMLMHVLAVCVVGGAILDRYLLPVLPVFYAAAAAGITALAPWLRAAASVGLLAGLLASLFWFPPFWPFPLDNNLAMVQFVGVHRQAAAFLESRLGDARIATAWPMSIELRRPELGYVGRPLPSVQELADFRPDPALALSPAPEVFVLFSRAWDPPASIFREPLLGEYARRYLDAYDPVAGHAIARRYVMQRIVRFEDAGQWVEIYARPREGTEP